MYNTHIDKIIKGVFMLKVGTTFTISQILPMCETNKEIVINDVHYKKSRVLKLVPTQGIVCPICGESATHFQYHATVGSKHPAIRLMFDHVDKAGSPAFMTVDHIIPTQLGGPNTLDNLQISCSVCNSLKGHNIEYKPQFPHRRVDWRLKLVYVAYIRWYIRVYHKDVSVGGLVSPKSTVRSEVRRGLSKADRLDIFTFDVSWKEVVRSIVELQNKQKVVVLFNEM